MSAHQPANVRYWWAIAAVWGGRRCEGAGRGGRGSAWWAARGGSGTVRRPWARSRVAPQVGARSPPSGRGPARSTLPRRWVVGDGVGHAVGADPSGREASGIDGSGDLSRREASVIDGSGDLSRREASGIDGSGDLSRGEASGIDGSGDLSRGEASGIDGSGDPSRGESSAGGRRRAGGRETRAEPDRAPTRGPDASSRRGATHGTRPRSAPSPRGSARPPARCSATPSLPM